MDEATLLDHEDLWVQEAKSVNGAELPLLTLAEQQLYTAAV